MKAIEFNLFLKYSGCILVLNQLVYCDLKVVKRLPIESHSSKSCKNWSECHHSSTGREKNATCQPVYIQMYWKDQ